MIVSSRLMKSWRDVLGEQPNARVSTLSLVISNLIPLFGVLFLGWNILTIMVLFWAENLIIGLFNVLKMATARGPGSVSKFFLMPFFAIHYGLFCLVHGMFVFALFGGAFGHGRMPNGFFDAPNFHPVQLMVPLLALLVSHGISFSQNYIKNGEYRNAMPPLLMFQPYVRIALLHVTIIFGGFAVMLLGASWPALALLVLLKIGMDLRGHLTERLRMGSGLHLGRRFEDRVRVAMRIMDQRRAQFRGETARQPVAVAEVSEADDAVPLEQAK